MSANTLVLVINNRSIAEKTCSNSFQVDMFLRLIQRGFSTSARLHPRLQEGVSKFMFNRIQLYNQRFTRKHRREIQLGKHKGMQFYDYGVKKDYIEHRAGIEHVPEMTPELIVPDLKGFKLKPYVSYRVNDIYQDEFTSKDLFNVIYGKKIMEDFKKGKLGRERRSLES